MVHALQRAGDFLRPGGVLLSIRPHRRSRPAVAIVCGRRRQPVTSLVNTPFERNLESADAALSRVVDEGRFRLVGTRSARYRNYLGRLSQMRTYLELITPPRPRFPPGSRRKLNQLWASAPRGARIEVTEWLVLDALQRR